MDPQIVGEILTRMFPEQKDDHVFSRAVALKSWDEKTRAFDVMAATLVGARGVRNTNSGKVEEELVLTPEAVRIDRANNYAPFIDSHGTNSMAGIMARLTVGIVNNDSVVGQIVPGSVRVDSEGIPMKVRVFTEDKLAPEGIRTVRKYIDGDQRNVSLDYKVHKWERIRAADRKDGVPMDLYRAIDWEIVGLSGVAAGFDDYAMSRAEELVTTLGRSLSATPMKKEQDMGNETTATTPGASAERSAPNGGNLDEAAIRADERKKAEESESQRVSEILSRGTQLKIDPETTRKYIADKTPAVDAIRAMIDTHAAQRAKETDINGSFSIDAGGEDVEKRAQGMKDALVHRLTLGQAKLTDQGKAYRGMTLTEMGQEILAGVGVRHGGRDREAIARDMIHCQRAATHSTSDFPLLFQDAVNKSLIVFAEAEPLTFTAFCRKGDATDFKTKHTVKIGGAPSYKETPEGKDYDFGTFSEEGESYKVKCYSAGLLLSRQMIANDDLDGISRMLEELASNGRTIQLDLVYDLLGANPKLSDGKELFHSASHHNKSGSAAAPSLETLAAAYAAMGSQTGPGGKKRLNLDPRVVLVPKAGDYRLKAHQIIFGAITAATAETTVPKTFFQELEIVADSRVAQAAWYAFANPMRAPVIEYAYLNGQDNPNVEQLESNRMVGVKYGVWIDFGVGLVDWRGAYINAA